MAHDKFTNATFETDHQRGLTWIESAETDDAGEWYSIWLLTHDGTGRVVAYIDGPTRLQICYGVYAEGHTSKRMYVSLESAKRYAIAAGMQLIGGEQCESARRRKMRHESRK